MLLPVGVIEVPLRLKKSKRERERERRHTHVGEVLHRRFNRME